MTTPRTQNCSDVLLSTSEVARLLGTSIEHVNRLVGRHTLRYVTRRDGQRRFRREDVELLTDHASSALRAADNVAGCAQEHDA